MIEIPLTRGYVAIVDDEDADLAEFKWCAAVNKDGSVYAKRANKSGHAPKKVYMHRIVLARMLGRELSKTDRTDHIYGKTLDNRRSQLRVATHEQNLHNSKLYRTSTSGLKGVSYHKRGKRWKAQLSVNRKQTTIGYFNTPEEAYAAYCEAAKKHRGEFARTGE